MRRVLAILALSALPRGAFGVEPETVSLEYSAPEACPSERVFSGEVSARTELVRFSDTSPSRRFHVTIEAREVGFGGRLEIVDAAGNRSVREITDESCRDVVSVLALVAALAVDPSASTAPRSELVMKAETPPEQAAPEQPKPEPTSPPPARPPPAPTLSPPVLPTLPAREMPMRLVFGAGAGLVATTAPAPEALFGPALFGRIEWRREALLSPLVRVSAAVARTGTIGASHDQARFSWGALRGELCPLRLTLAAYADVRPCAFADLGLEHAEGTGAPRPRSATRVWSSLGASAWLRLFSDFGAFASLGGGLAAPLSRYHFVFDNPREPVYDVPALSAHAEILVGYDFE